MEPKVTIVTPTFDKPRHFAECAAAVLTQKFTDWVWWVVFNHTTTYTWSELGYDDKLLEDHRIVPLYYPVNPEYRRDTHVPASIVNWLYPKITTDYIYFLADDDLIDPDGLGVLVDKMEHMPIDEHNAVYGHCDILTEQPDGSYTHAGWLHPGDPTVTRALGADISGNISTYDIGLGTGIQPDCLIDGGQVLHTKALWDRATICEKCGGKGCGSTFSSNSKTLTTEWQEVSNRYTSDPCLACKSTGRSWQLDTRPDEEHASHNDGTLLNRLAEFARFHYVPQRIVTHRRTRLSRWHKPIGS